MANRSKQKGTAWETAIVGALRAAGIESHRQPPSGAKDTGDIWIPSARVVIEAKNTRAIKLAEFADEAETEARNSDAALGVCWIHRKGKADPREGYVVLRGDDFMTIVELIRRYANRL